MINRGKRSVLGVNVNVVDYEAAVAQIITAAQLRRPLAVSALAVHGVMTGALDPTHMFRLNRFDLTTPDGQPVRWALKALHGESLPDRVYGPNLTKLVCQAAAQHDLSIYLYGSRTEVLEAWMDNLRSELPTLRIAGYEPSKFRMLDTAEAAAVDHRIAQSGADIVMVGLGCPRQEIFVFEHVDAVRRPMLAVGAAFDFHAGLLRQAPRWMQDLGLEWLFRLLMEPRRLWKRYAIYNPLFAWMTIKQAVGKLQLAPSTAPSDPVRPG